MGLVRLRIVTNSSVPQYVSFLPEMGLMEISPDLYRLVPPPVRAILEAVLADAWYDPGRPPGSPHVQG